MNLNTVSLFKTIKISKLRNKRNIKILLTAKSWLCTGPHNALSFDIKKKFKANVSKYEVETGKFEPSIPK